MTGHKVGMITYIQTFGGLHRRNLGGPKIRKFGSISDNFRLWPKYLRNSPRNKKSETNLIDSYPCWVQQKIWWTSKKLQARMLTRSSSKFGTIWVNFKLWLLISLERIDIPKVDNKLDRLPSLPRWTKKFGQLWSTNKEVAGADVGPP